MWRAAKSALQIGAYSTALFAAGCADPDNARIIFVSSQTYYPDELGGADTHCQTLASAAGLPNPRGFAALVYPSPHPDINALLERTPELGAGASTSPDTDTGAGPSSGPIVLTCGETVADSFADLAGFLQHAVDRDENGKRVGAGVWTGAAPLTPWSPALGDVATDYTCDAWSSRDAQKVGGIGDSGARSSDWYSMVLDPEYATCAQRLHIYCIETG